MPPEARRPLFDMLRACRRINHSLDGKTLVDHEGDELLRSAVERQFGIAEVAALLGNELDDA